MRAITRCRIKPLKPLLMAGYIPAILVLLMIAVLSLSSDRIRDVVITGGFNVYPNDVEVKFLASTPM